MIKNDFLIQVGAQAMGVLGGVLRIANGSKGLLQLAF
jgi:hypothetical protein